MPAIVAVYALSGSASVAALETSDQAGDARPQNYWESQGARWFVGGDLAAGAFNRVRVGAGYGKPHWMWAGVDAQAASTTEFATGLVGLRADLLLINATVAARSTWSYSRRRLAIAESYRDADLTRTAERMSRYVSLDAWLWGYLPAGPLLGYWEFGAIWVPSVPRDGGVFEEFLRHPMVGATALSGRLVVWVPLLDDALLVGPAADVVDTSERGALWRAGPSVGAQLTDHLRADAAWTFAVASPDRLDWFTESWGLGRVTWTWATGEPEPGWR
jgi:hypothetical protein